MLNTSSRDQLFPTATAAGNRSSWSSSGETSYYDAKDHLTGDESADNGGGDGGGSVNPAFGGVETSQDLQAAHDLATAYYHDNAAYAHDSGNANGNGNGALKAFYKKKQSQQAKKQPVKKARLPYHLTAETNVDSTTTADEAGSGREDGDEAEDDFGFKYRPAIPPPRQLMQSPGMPQQASLTLEDTLSMKRPTQPVSTPVPAHANTSSGILLETNIDSEMDDNSSIPSSYYPDAVLKQPYLSNHLQDLEQHRMPDGPHASLSGNRTQPSAQQQIPVARVAASFQFNTAVREEDETTDESMAPTPVAKEKQPPPTDSSDGETATEVEVGRWSESSATAIGIHEEVPRMATWSTRSPTSPSSTVIEAAGHYKSLNSPYKSPTATSLSMSAYSQASPISKQQQQHWKKQQQTPPRMIARLDTDFEVSTDEADFSETTPGDMAILEYSRALEEADRMRHAAAGRYVFAQPPGSQNTQLTNSVPEYINYAGRDSATIGSIGLRGAKSMNMLNSSRNSLRSTGVVNSNKALLTPGRARRASLRRSRLGLTDTGDGGGGGIYSIHIEDTNQVLSSGNSRTNFALGSLEPDFQVPEVQHHGPLRSSMAKPSGPLACCHRCADSCCPNTPRKIVFRWVLVGGIIACAILLAVAIAVIVVSTRPKETASGA